MRPRHTLTLATLAAFAGGCNLSHAGGADGAVSGPDGGGVCCPLAATVRPCSVGFDPLPGGGWAPSLAACEYTISGWDIDFDRTIDDRGCPIWRASTRCCLCPPDGGPPPPPPIDAGPAPCEGLSWGGCLARAPDCVPTYHDACCSSCEPSMGCADCTDWQFWACRSAIDACDATHCSRPARGECAGARTDCAAARVVGRSCDTPGCVPAVAAEGAMDPVEPCVEVTGATCLALCFALPPSCPMGTSAEADGACWTGRCIPADVCAP
mgnify:CR=1 FL=1